MFRVGPGIVAVASLSLLSWEATAQTTTPEAPSDAAGSSSSPTSPPPPPRASSPSLAASAAPEPPAPFRPDVYPPPEARVRTLLVGGGLLVAGYGLALGTSYLWDGAPGMQSLRTPVVGPVMAVAEGKCGSDEGPGCSTVTVVLRAVLAGIAGLAQVGGIGVLTEGVFMTTGESRTVTARAPAWYALPTASKSGAGVCIGASF